MPVGNIERTLAHALAKLTAVEPNHRTNQEGEHLDRVGVAHRDGDEGPRVRISFVVEIEQAGLGVERDSRRPTLARPNPRKLEEQPASRTSPGSRAACYRNYC